MRRLRKLLLALPPLALACGGGVYPEQYNEPVRVAAASLEADGWGSPLGFVLLFPYPEHCLGEPWTSLHPLRDPNGGCLRGQTLYLAAGCIIAFAMDTESYADTSLAHELGHHLQLDPFHSWYPSLWSESVPRAREALMEAGL